MTLDEFLVELKKTPRDWFLYSTLTMHGGIRRKDLEHYWQQCPLSAVDGTMRHYMYNREKLGISKELEHEILSAADNTSTADPEVRKKLLEACGL